MCVESGETYRCYKAHIGSGPERLHLPFPEPRRDEGSWARVVHSLVIDSSCLFSAGLRGGGGMMPMTPSSYTGALDKNRNVSLWRCLFQERFSSEPLRGTIA